MSKPHLAPGKKRYSVSLTQKRVERFQSLCREFGLPPSTMSGALDDTLQGLGDMFQDAKDRGTMNMSDLFRLMGKQFDLMIEEERSEKNVREKRKETPKQGIS